MSAALPAMLLTAVALLALLLLDARTPWASWLFKPLASAGFLWAALRCGAVETAYGWTVLLALVLCWGGDVLLIPKGARAAFLAGLSSFLAGHVLFVWAFLQRDLAPGWLAAAALVVAPAGMLALGWLRPHVPRPLVAPVWGYVIVISAMVLAASGAAGGTGDLRLLAGASAFFVSDLAVARERFVAPSRWNRVWGLPLYYGATLLLATTVGT